MTNAQIHGVSSEAADVEDGDSAKIQRVFSEPDLRMNLQDAQILGVSRETETAVLTDADSATGVGGSLPASPVVAQAAPEAGDDALDAGGGSVEVAPSHPFDVIDLGTVDAIVIERASMGSELDEKASK